MANPLAKQVLNHLAQKAGERGASPASQNEVTPAAQAPVKLNPDQEKHLVDLIQLRQTLYPGKERETAQSSSHRGMHAQADKGRMVSLSELAGKGGR